MATEVEDRFFEHDGIHYFRGKAATVSLGSYGRKRTPPFRPNFLDPDGHLNLNNVTIKPRLRLKASAIKLSAKDLSVKFNIFERGTVSADATIATLEKRQSELELVLFSLELGEVKKLVNADDEARDLLDDNQGLGRVAHEIWVVMTVTEATEFSNSARLGATVTKDGVVVSTTAGASGSGSAKITLSEGSTFAYLLARPIRRNNQITSFISDQQGGV